MGQSELVLNLTPELQLPRISPVNEVKLFREGSVPYPKPRQLSSEQWLKSNPTRSHPFPVRDPPEIPRSTTV